MRLSSNFTENEFLHSNTALRLKIDNSWQDKKYRDNAIYLCKYFLEPIRKAYGRALFINSGYRCPELNKTIGGAQNSAHMYGLAVDIDSRSKNKIEQNKKIFKIILDLQEEKIIPRWDQLIWEYGGQWIHLGIVAPFMIPRAEIINSPRI